jgi:DNA polymerase-3 subunit gamma/tau
LKDEKKHSVYPALLQASYKRDDQFNIRVSFSHQTADDIFKNVSPYLTGWLKVKLNNVKIRINSSIDTAQETASATPYTNSDKFQHLAEKNPILLELKNRLNLEIK